MKRVLVILGCAAAVAVLAAAQSQFIPGNLTVGGLISDPGGTNYVKDAPGSGGPYARQSNAWVTTSGSGISHGPSDGLLRGSRNGGWGEISALDISSGTLGIARGGTGAGDAATARANFNVPTRTGGDASGTWGISITGDANTLDGIDSTGFAPASHTHGWADITGEPDFALVGHTHAAADIASGVIATARLGSGTANSSVFLRGDGTWATPTLDPGATNGLGDAPNDGVFYGRKSGGWVNPSASDIGSGTFAVARLGSGSSSSSKFLRGGASSGSWDTIATADVLGITSFGSSLVGSSDAAGGRSVLLLGNSATRNVGTGSGDVATGNHGHIIADTTGLQAALDNKANSTHTHAIADTTGLQAALDGKAPTSRTISTTHSLTGGGDLTANRTLSLVGDTASPGNSKYYGTDGSGTRGWHALPAASGDAPFAYAAFTDPGGTPTTPSDCTVIAGSSSGIYGVYRADQGLYRIDLLASQPTSQFKRVEIATVASSFYMWMGTVISNATYRSQGTNVFVAITQASSTSNLETAVPTMIRIYSH